jgi:hypothetical protein
MFKLPLRIDIVRIKNLPHKELNFQDYNENLYIPMKIFVGYNQVLEWKE